MKVQHKIWFGYTSTALLSSLCIISGSGGESWGYGIAAAVAFSSLGMAYFTSSSITRGIDSVSKTLDGFRAGSHRYTGVVPNDEFGHLQNLAQHTIENVLMTLKGIGESAAQLSYSSDTLSSLSRELGSHAEDTASETSSVAGRAGEVSTNVEIVAASVEEMGASINEIARSASEAAKIAVDAVKVAESTNQVVSKLGDSSTEIGNVIKVITSIAEQTNLLALNATIEAARAGEAGKGFAVVANEVKELAKETAKATEEISAKIEVIQSDTKDAVDAIGKIGGIIDKIHGISNSIASAVVQQNATTSEMARNVTEAAKGSASIANSLSTIASGSQNTTHAAHETQTAATELTKIAAELQRLVHKLGGGEVRRGETQPATTSRGHSGHGRPEWRA